MTENSESNLEGREYETNITLSYEYVEKSVQEVKDIINNTNTQLGVLIGFNFTFIRFFINDLPNRIVSSHGLFCNSCILFKILAYGFSFVSIILGLIGLYQTVELKIIKPNSLINECDKVFNWELKLAIIDKWQQKLEDFEKLNKLKKKLLNYSIILLGISGLFAVMDYALAFFLG